MYQTAYAAQEYYAVRNIEILNRLTYLQKHGLTDSKVKFHKICSAFFPKLVKQLSQYLLGNGVTMDENVKKKLGLGFDKSLQKAGMQALVDGVNWGFWNVDKLIIFRATEFVPLYDEQNGDLRAGIRFWRIDSDKPLYVEMFEEDGITKYGEENDSSLRLIEEKRDYIQKIRTDALGSEIIDTDNYPTIPVFALYANDLKQSEFTTGIRSMIDAYDFINSDLVDGITQIEGIYWVVKNYGGNDMAELLKDMQQLHATYTEGADGGADSQIIEIPYQAKQAALGLLRKQIYADFMALDMDTLTGSSLTNVAINTAKTDLDLKADMFEWQCADFVQGILGLLGIDNVEPQFKRRSITNDTETISNLSTMLDDGYITKEFAVKHNPLIPDIEQEELIKELAIEQQKDAENTFPIDKESEEEEEDQQQVVDEQKQE